MPRAVGVFRRVGWHNLIPFPVDFATDEQTTLENFQGEFKLGANLQVLSEAIREYIGLVAYYYLGRTTSLLPGPDE
jgi:hypothetical protein